MKVNEILTEAYPIGYNPERKTPLGKASEWMKAIGATPEDIAKARAEVKKSPEYQTLVDKEHIFKDVSSPRHESNGSIALDGYYIEPKATFKALNKNTGEVATDEDRKSPSFYQDFKFVEVPDANGYRTVKLKYTIHPHGKIDFTAPNGYHRWPAPSGKTALVKDKPVESIVKSMRLALRELDKLVAKRLEKANKAFATRNNKRDPS